LSHEPTAHKSQTDHASGTLFSFSITRLSDGTFALVLGA
jgi:hypothetical protein